MISGALRIAAFLLLAAVPAQASANAELIWKGQIKVWEADLCAPKTGPGPFAALVDPLIEPGCVSLPKPVGTAWKVELPIRDESANGYHVVSRTSLEQTIDTKKWTIVVLVMRMNTGDPKTSYLSVQTSLKEAKFGLVAQCSRFDAIGAFSFLPPGSCSGQMEGKLVGVSLYSPLAAGATE